jgi:hypothetical protein
MSLIVVFFWAVHDENFNFEMADNKKKVRVSVPLTCTNLVLSYAAIWSLALEVGFSLFQEGLGPLVGVLGLEDV